MTDARILDVEMLIEDSGRVFNPDTGLIEDTTGSEDDSDFDLDPHAFLAALGITDEECAEYVQRKIKEIDDEFRD